MLHTAICKKSWVRTHYPTQLGESSHIQLPAHWHCLLENHD